MIASAACTTLPVTEAATALVAAAVAAIGTLVAKHRPAGARTRRGDVAFPVDQELVERGRALELDEALELEPFWWDEEHGYVEEPPPPPRSSRIRAAARALRGR